MSRSKLLALLGTALLTATSAIAGDTNDGLIAWYPFDEEVDDKTGNFEIQRLMTPQFVDGKFGGAVKLDGETFIALPIDLGPDLVPSITISLWVKTDPRPTDAELEKNLSSTIYVVSESIAIGNLNGDSPYFYGYALNHSISGPKHTTRRGQWQHVAMVRTIEDRPNAEGEIVPHVVAQFHSGGRMSEVVRPFRGQGMETDLYLGTNSPRYPAGHRFRGALDELRIYERALSKEEVGLLAKARSSEFSFGVEREMDPRGADTGAPENGRIIDTTPLDNVDAGGLSTGDMAIDDPTDSATDGNGDAPTYVGLPTGNQFSIPDSQADDLSRGIDDPDIEGRQYVADWRLVGMVPFTAEQLANDIYPGSELTIKIRLKKDDSTNKIPDVRLEVDSRDGRAKKVVSVTEVTTEAAPIAQRDVPVTLTVPNNISFGADASAALWRPVVTVLNRNGLELQDADPGNHQRELSIHVSRPTSDSDCGAAVTNDDGTRTAGDCLESGKQSDLSGLGYNVQIDTESVSGDYGTIIEKVSFYQDQALLTGLDTFERNNKPCRVAIKGATLGDASNLREGVDHCMGKQSFIGINTPQRHIPFGFGLTGMQVCFSFQSERVKGLRAYVRRIKPSGSLEADESKFDLLKRPNCTRWQNIARCNSGSVATGAELHFRDGNILARTPFLVGVRLMCSELKETTT